VGQSPPGADFRLAQDDKPLLDQFVQQEKMGDSLGGIVEEDNMGVGMALEGDGRPTDGRPTTLYLLDSRPADNGPLAGY
jgi:hypothetical protein